MRVRAELFLLAVAACGGKVEQVPVVEDGDPRAGFVKCGDRDAGACEVTGNQCYSCTNAITWRCHTLDLPPECSRDIRVLRECDGPEDCRAGKTCVLDAYGTTQCL